MTVKELIELLKRQPEDAVVQYVYDGPDTYLFKDVEVVNNEIVWTPDGQCISSVILSDRKDAGR